MKSVKESLELAIAGKLSYDAIAKQFSGQKGDLTSQAIDEAVFEYTMSGALPDWHPQGVSSALIAACEAYLVEPSAKTAMAAARASGLTMAQAIAVLGQETNEPIEPIQLAIQLVSVAEKQRETKDEVQPEQELQPRVILRKGYPVYRDSNGRTSVTWVGDCLHIIAQEPTFSKSEGRVVMSDCDRIPGYVGKMRGLKLRIEAVEENPDILPRFVSDDDACKVIDLADGEFIDISDKFGLLN